VKHVLVAALVLGLAACASAQSARPLHSETTDKASTVAKPDGGAAMGMAHDTEGALASLETELKITAKQAKVWRTFAAAYRAFAASKPHMPMKKSGMKCCSMMNEDEHAGSGAEDLDEHASTDTGRDEHAASSAKDQNQRTSADIKGRDELAALSAKDQNQHAGSDIKGRDEHASSGAEDGDEHASSDSEGRDEHAGSIVNRTEMHMKMMQSRLKALRKLNAALKPLYASLTKQQRETADQMLPKLMKMGHMM